MVAVAMVVAVVVVLVTQLLPQVKASLIRDTQAVLLPQGKVLAMKQAQAAAVLAQLVKHLPTQRQARVLMVAMVKAQASRVHR
jgi:hypothetical protein